MVTLVNAKHCPHFDVKSKFLLQFFLQFLDRTSKKARLYRFPTSDCAILNQTQHNISVDESKAIAIYSITGELIKTHQAYLGVPSSMYEYRCTCILQFFIYLYNDRFK